MRVRGLTVLFHVLSSYFFLISEIRVQVESTDDNSHLKKKKIIRNQIHLATDVFLFTENASQIYVFQKINVVWI